EFLKLKLSSTRIRTAVSGERRILRAPTCFFEWRIPDRFGFSSKVFPDRELVKKCRKSGGFSVETQHGRRNIFVVVVTTFSAGAKLVFDSKTMRNIETLLLVFGLTQVWGAQVDVQPKELLVLPGQNASFLCRVGVPLQYCRAELPNHRSYNLNKLLPAVDGLSYEGQGLEAGQCGVHILYAEEKHNGPIKCTLGIPSETTESVGVMNLIVAKAPKMPELDLSRGTDSLRVYKINDYLEASCLVRDGRPVANISWFIDDEQINEAGLKMATVIEIAKEHLQSKVQNLSRILQPSDNGKFLRCVAYHPAYPGGYAETKRQLDVKFAPLPITEPQDKFGYQIGRVGNISIIIEANPKPKIEWTIGGQKIREGSTDNTGRIEAEAIKDLGRGKYEANLRLAAITKQDTEVDYRLTAYNDQGSQEYRIKISTNPEPEGVELGVGAIIGVVVVVLLAVLIASILIFAKLTGRWCFNGGATVIDYTTGENGQPPLHDGVSGDGVDNPHHQVSNEYINGNDLPIKKDEKINTAV
ncbi:unnamed protein product, partial [Phyllotreta striolata]